MTNSKNSSNNSSESNELYAIAETSGQQFWFEVDRYYDIDRLNAKEKDKITPVSYTHLTLPTKA